MTKEAPKTMAANKIPAARFFFLISFKRSTSPSILFATQVKIGNAIDNVITKAKIQPKIITYSLKATVIILF